MQNQLNITVSPFITKQQFILQATQAFNWKCVTQRTSGHPSITWKDTIWKDIAHMTESKDRSKLGD